MGGIAAAARVGSVVSPRRSPVGSVVAALLTTLALVAVGCGQAQPTQSAAAATAAPSSSVPGTVSHAPSASAKPSPAPEKAAIAGFVKLVTKAGFSYEATVTGRSRHTTTRLPVKGSIAVSGRDYRVTAAFTFDTGVGRVEHRYVGGKAWVRVDRGRWQTLAGFKPSSSMSPFAEVRGVESVRFLDTRKVDGRTQYRIEIQSVPLHPSLIPAYNLTKETVTRGVLELFIDDAGRPVSGRASIEGTGRVSGQLQEIVIELDLTFTHLGQKVTVSAP